MYTNTYIHMYGYTCIFVYVCKYVLRSMFVFYIWIWKYVILQHVLIFFFSLLLLRLHLLFVLFFLNIFFLWTSWYYFIFLKHFVTTIWPSVPNEPLWWKLVTELCSNCVKLKNKTSKWRGKRLKPTANS